MDWYRTVWRRGKLIGFILPRPEGIAVYSTEDVRYSEEFLNTYNIITIRNDKQDIIGVQGETPTSINAYNEINSPEIVMIF